MNTGQKIKTARKLRNISSNELAFLSNLAPDRIRAYEAGSRTPKEGQLQVFADNLGIPIDFFKDHKIDNDTDIFQILFELEDKNGLSVEKNGSSNYVLSTKDCFFNMALEKWYLKKQAYLNGECTKEEYDLWRARFPISVADDDTDYIHKTMIQEKSTSDNSRD